MKRRYRFLQFVFNLRDWLVAEAIFLSLKAMRLLPMESTGRFLERTARWIGPKTGRHKIAMDNLAIAFPEKSIEEREQIAIDSWAHIARGILEYGYLDQIFDLDENNPGAGRIEVKNVEQFFKLRDTKGAGGFPETGRKQLIRPQIHHRLHLEGPFAHEPGRQGEGRTGSPE